MAHKCRVHGVTRAVYKIAYFNDEGELVYEHVYCIQCYDLFLQRNLEMLHEHNEDDEKEKHRL